MSGLIFSLLLGAVAISSLIEALRQNPKFRELEKDRSWRGSVREDNRSVEVFVKRDNRQIQFILPDLSIPEETCKKAVEKLSATLCAEIEDESARRSIGVVGPSHSFCHYCLEPAKELLFRCKRCGRYYCSEHRFPEEHDCPGEQAVGMRTRQSQKRTERDKIAEEKPKKILLKEIPCG